MLESETLRVGQPPRVTLTQGWYYTFSGLNPSENYLVQCSATNTAGTSALSTAITVETAAALTAPGNPTLATGAPGTTTMALVATASGSGGAAASFNFRAAPVSTGTYGSASTGESANFTMTGLTANTPYDFEVSATNAAGTSGWSTAVQATTAATLAAPGVPTLALGSGGVTTTTIPVVATPAGSGGTVATYNFQIAPSGGSYGSPVNQSSPNFTFTGLTPGASYNCQVSAENAAGTSAESAALPEATLASATYGTTKPTHYFVTDGSGNGNASVPNASNLNPGDAVLDVQVLINAPSFDMLSGVFSGLVRKDGGNGTGWGCGISQGALSCFLSDHSSAVAIFVNLCETQISTLFGTGYNGWVRFQMNNGTAASQGVPGTPGMGFVTTSQPVYVGESWSNPLAANTVIERATITIGGTLVLDIDFTQGTTAEATQTATTGQVVTIDSPGAVV